ncbi:hypothetical protein AGDE_15671 [Angomonas deanei]|uniref:Uncharacterized protein n=1 Tax=Angomonas deanei TaxID=59799 RepID=A0A7G2CT28_9TRYP|nr:hypothetical protein AGDE_15671 [Angomonas deanei]CAD2222201.1 hypothetical protein, conserved [Angomonas deanei]|eukprot:EPY18682.1 hypothetical protein AGDE_15671 [Angomonas deanei]
MKSLVIHSFMRNGSLKSVFVFDEAAACPWVYRSVNQVLGGNLALSELFGQQNPFAEKIRVVCCSTATQGLYRGMLSTQSSFDPVIMRPSREVYERIVESMDDYKTRKNFIGRLVKNPFFEKLVENRGCGVVAAEVVRNAAEGSPAELVTDTLTEEQKKLFDSSDEEGAYSIAGSIVADQYRKSNGSSGKPIEELKRIVATCVRALLCCPKRGYLPIVNDTNVIKMGMLSVVSSPMKDGSKDRKLELEMSSVQLVLGAMLYGDRSLLTKNLTGRPFVLFSASFFSLLLDSCSSSYYVGKTDVSLSAFLRPLSHTAIGDYSAKMDHISVSSVLVSNERIEVPEKVQTYLRVLRELLRDNNGRAFVLVNGRGTGYADFIAKSGNILFLIHCEKDAKTTTKNVPTALEKMGFSGSDSPAVDTFVESLDMSGPNMEEQLENFLAKGAQRKRKRSTAVSGTTVESLPLLRGKLLTRLLMKELGCSIAVPVVMRRKPRSADTKEKCIKYVEKYSFQSFGWNGPAALVLVGGSIERSAIISA